MDNNYTDNNYPAANRIVQDPVAVIEFDRDELLGAQSALNHMIMAEECRERMDKRYVSLMRTAQRAVLEQLDQLRGD